MAVPIYTQASINNLLNYTYANTLGEKPDQTGIDYWTGQLQSGAVNMDNFQKTFDTAAREGGKTLLSDIALVNNIFKKGLGKEASQDDINFWTKELSSGRVNPSNLVQSIADTYKDKGITLDTAKIQQSVRDDYNSQMLGYDVSMTDPFEFKPVDFKAEGYDPNAKFVFNQDDPSYQFRLKQGIDALDKSAASRGMLQSGAQEKAITQYGQDVASQEYSNAYNRYMADQTNKFNLTQGAKAASGQRDLTKYNTQQNALLNLSNLGTGAAAQIQSAGNVLGTQVTGAMGASGNAQASGYVGAGNAQANGITNQQTAINQGLENALFYSKYKV